MSGRRGVLCPPRCVRRAYGTKLPAESVSRLGADHFHVDSAHTIRDVASIWVASLGPNEHIGYCVMDVDATASTIAIDELQNVPGTIRARLLY